MRDFQRPGRSAAYAANGMVATSHPEATRAGLAVLQRGGGAADAALAASAVLCVAEPQNAGLGGDSFYMHAAGDGRVDAFNGSGRTPAALDTERTGPIGDDDGHAVVVPGAVDAWARLHADHGRLSLDELLAPAIRLAEEGVIVTPRVAWDWRASAARLAVSPTARAVFTCVGEPFAVGERIHQPALAGTLRAIAADGARAFYEGGVAAGMTATLRAAGGAHAEEDFAAHVGEAVTPVSTGYRGLSILECPPNSQGLTVLLMLNVLAGLDVEAALRDPAAFHHLLAEVTVAAYAERDLWCADPAFTRAPLERLLSPEFAAAMRSDLGLARRRTATAEPAHRDTVYLAAVDRDGNAVSFITSLFRDFGSAILDQASGVLFNNRAASFVRIEGHPNALAPAKRPMHTIIPGLAMRDGRPVMPFGVMGGHYQAAGQVHQLAAMLDGGLDPQEALEQPRSFASGGVLEAETALPDPVVDRLQALGHRVVRAARPIGGGQAIWIDHHRGLLVGGSDPRKDGCAEGY